MAILFATMLGFTACSDDDKVNISTVSITTTVDTTIEGLQLTGGTYTFENINTSVKTDVAYPLQSIELADGLYNVTFIGKGTYSQNGTSVEVDVQGVQQNVTVSGGSCKLELTVHVLNTGEPGFVIAEIFIPGTYNEAGKQYNGDQYVRIYNNSDKVLYADGLIFMESQFQTTQKYQSVDPDIMNEAIAVGSVVAVPGSGTDHPVQPGESFILCDNAINHKEANPNSIDLSKANFEWYIESKQDVDNPAVPNLDIYYCYSKTIWVLNKQGNRAYAIGRLPQGMTKEKYISDYAYNYTIPALGTTHADYFFGDIPCTRGLSEEEVQGEYELNTGKVIIETLGDAEPLHTPGIVVYQHGPFAWGKDAHDAVHNAVVMEEVAKMAWIARSINPQLNHIDSFLMNKHFMRKHGPNAYYGQK